MDQLEKMSDRELAELQATWESAIGPAVEKGLDKVGKMLAGFKRKDGARDARRIIGAQLLAFAIVETSKIFKLEEIRTMTRATIEEIAAERGEL